MPEISAYKSVSITELMTNIEKYKYNPSNVQRVILDYLDEVTGGEVDVVDPTNPFVFLLEASSVNTVVAINENIINLRKQYPSLAQTEEDLYLHMSDKDYSDRFATPSNTVFTFVMKLSDITNKMHYSALDGCHKATLPRDTEITIDDLIFTFQYPIDVRKFSNGLIQISYDATYLDSLKTLDGNIIDYELRRDGEGVQWIFFNVNISQFKIITSYHNLQQSIAFEELIPYDDSFYYCKVYNKSSNTADTWVELLTTHTDQVYDPFTPTATLTVYEGALKILIPIIYLSTGLLDGSIRVDIYTTKGLLSVNLGDHKLTSFNVSLKAIDEERDINDYTIAMSELSFMCYSDKIINGGRVGMTFETLRENVINNSIGVRSIPITNAQLSAYVSNKGFDLIKDIDVITNRVFLATKKLPKPFNSRLITSANIGIGTFITNLNHLKSLSSVFNNGDRITINSNNLYQLNNGMVSIIEPTKVLALKNLPTSSKVNNINSTQYLYSPFYYVLDSSQREFEVRTYDLDNPTAKDISFIEQNQTLQLPVNTSSYEITKDYSGYKLRLLTKSGTFYRQLPDELVRCQIGFMPTGEGFLAYLTGTQISVTEDGERVFEFSIETNHDINSNNDISITNFKMFNNEPMNTWCPLLTDFHIFHTTSSIASGYVGTDMDNKIASFLLPRNSAVASYEKIKLNLGNVLKNLWTRTRSMASGMTYNTYQDSIPMMYDKDIYEQNIATGSILNIDASGNVSYNKIHSLGDVVKDHNDNIVYKHKKGDVVLDSMGNPTINTVLSSDKELDLLFIDGKYYFADDDSLISYRNEIARTLTEWIVTDLTEIQKVLLEQTKLYFFPRTSLGLINVFPDNAKENKISAEQSLVVDFYVSDKIYRDSSLRDQITNGVIKLLDDYIDNETVNVTEIIIALNNNYKDIAESIKVSGLGGVGNNYQLVKITDKYNRLCLRKLISAQQDNKLIIKEDVTVSFHNVERVID